MQGIDKICLSDNLRRGLSELHPGKISESNKAHVENLLSDYWNLLDGNCDGGMAASKIFNRTEKLEWNPPFLSFDIERHGATVNGSTRADLQTWVVDVDCGRAYLASIRKRQLCATDQRLDVKKIATEVAEIIRERRTDERVCWRGETVLVRTGIIIPATNRQTTANRRRRFSSELIQALRPLGWRLRPGGTRLVFESAIADEILTA